ncbi:hypothetical protein GCM10012286_19070 [Streptomyces lasiicapitis]|uniref:Glycoside hydrolase family 31 TIM barrel domain-containing protein n=1 Tax=Streptomyces lasiicapitis TaxID=1923961 RepID=A0ABQ2LN04_9ACTN|nr:hypothetical protein GCM10012286_19070 [Streptomyces lasiicapitis]
MKFTDGCWLMRGGVRAAYATEVRDLRADDDRCTACAAVQRVRGRGDTPNTVFARSATAGGQRFPVHRSHGIGGFEGTPSPAVFKRRLAVGPLPSHSRPHGKVPYRLPWAFGAEAAAVARKFKWLKHRLMPCPYAAAALPEGIWTHLLPGVAVRGTAGEVG